MPHSARDRPMAGLVLCRHASMAEHPAVWSAFVDDLAVLGAAPDRSRALSFLRDLFARFPFAIGCQRGVFFLARAIRWLPSDFLEESLSMIAGSGWPWREQAIGEVAMLRSVLDPADAYCRSVVARAIEVEPKETSSDLRRAGVAFATVNLWAEPAFRARTHEVLMKLAAAADGYLPGAIMDIFRVTAPLPPDAKTREPLSVIAEKPDLIRGGGPSFITKRLKELLSDGFSPNVVAAVMRALLTASGSAVGDIRTAWSADAGSLIEIAITLQRFPETRSAGLDLFEMLMDLAPMRRVRYCVSWIVGRFEGLIGLVIASGTGALGLLPRSVRCSRHHGFEAPNVTHRRGPGALP